MQRADGTEVRDKLVHGSCTKLNGSNGMPVENGFHAETDAIQALTIEEGGAGNIDSVAGKAMNGFTTHAEEHNSATYCNGEVNGCVEDEEMDVPSGPSDVKTSGVVISGIACRLPESDNIEEFQEHLYNGDDMITQDDRRWIPGTHVDVMYQRNKYWTANISNRIL